MKQRQEGGHEFVDPLAAKQAHGESTSPAMPQLRKIPGKEEGKAPKNGKEQEAAVSPGLPVKLRKVERAPTTSPQGQGIPVQLKKVETTPTPVPPAPETQTSTSTSVPPGNLETNRALSVPPEDGLNGTGAEQRKAEVPSPSQTEPPSAVLLTDLGTAYSSEREAGAKGKAELEENACVEPQAEGLIKDQLDGSTLRELAIDETPLDKTVTGPSRCFAISIVLVFGFVLMAAVVIIGRWPEIDVWKNSL
jgi:hypothetical protein